jgi:hypothetical protein
MPISRQRYLISQPGTYYLDLWRNTSIQERRMHRQFQVCHVRGGLIKDSNNESVVRMNVAPDTWVTRTAVRRGKKLWDKHIKEGTEGLDLQLIKPKYHDYKVLLNPAQPTSISSAANLTAVDAAGNELPAGEWKYSVYFSEDVDWSNANLLASANRDADQFTACIVGEHTQQGNTPYWEQIGLIRSWLDSRPGQDPSGTPFNTQLEIDAMTADPLVNLFDEADTSDEIVEELAIANDRPPYDEDVVFGLMQAGNNIGDNLQRVAMAATQSGAGQIASLDGFSAICGLVQVHVTQGSGSGAVEIILDVETKGAKI